MNRRNGPERDYRSLRVAASLTTIGLTLAISIAVGVGLGLALDRWLGTNWLVIVFTLLGVIAGFKQLIQTVLQANRDQEAIERDERRRHDADEQDKR